jgi:hypothetical protein
MRYRPEHKAEIHQKIVKDASQRVRAEGLNGAVIHHTAPIPGKNALPGVSGRWTSIMRRGISKSCVLVIFITWVTIISFCLMAACKRADPPAARARMQQATIPIWEFRSLVISTAKIIRGHEGCNKTEEKADCCPGATLSPTYEPLQDSSETTRASQRHCQHEMPG